MVPQVESDHKDPSGYPRLAKPAVWGRVPTGPSFGAPCPYPRRESRVVQPNELLHKGSGIKAVFFSPHYHEGHAWGSPHAVWAEASTPQTTSFPGRLTEVRTPEVATRLQVRLRVGRLTLGLTVADRWECSQATGLPAWRHQDLSTSQPLGHTVSRALKQKNLYLGTGPGWTLCKSMYPATQGAFVFRFVSLRGEKQSISR